MENERNKRLKFESALQKYEMDFYKETPYEKENIRYSKKNYFRTLRMIRKINSDKKAKTPMSLERKIAVLLVAALCSLIMISAAKKPLTDFIVRTYERYIELMVRGENENAPEMIRNVYNAIGYLPHGYYRAHVFENGFAVQTVWKNRENDELILYQTLYSSRETLMGKDNQYEFLYISDYEVLKSEKNGRVFFFWSFKGYAFELSGPYTVTQEEYHRMITNLLKGWE